jgi:hypothetical protein
MPAANMLFRQTHAGAASGAIHILILIGYRLSDFGWLQGYKGLPYENAFTWLDEICQDISSFLFFCRQL